MPVPGKGGLSVISDKKKGLMPEIFGAREPDLIPAGCLYPRILTGLTEKMAVQGLFELMLPM
ncbi:MAG: hypothetical protein R3D26_15130 [Cyanobacteriota/Melainabacteria group bacterium]